jgi:predicted esterase
MTFNGQRVKIWAGAPAHGPLVIYWYATGSSVAEVTRGLGQAAIDDITSQGGVVAAMYKTTATGQNTGNNVWYTGDFDTTDEVVACAVQQQHIDTRHIHALGFSAGGLQSGYMAFARSNYMASVVTYSGGSLSQALQDPSNAPSVMCQHGDPGSDVVIIDFATASTALETAIKTAGGFAMDCHHPGGHMIPSGDVPSSWRFLKDHPYKVNPKPYAGGIPSGFPSYCTIP